jgi:hypothetical protein
MVKMGLSYLKWTIVPPTELEAENAALKAELALYKAALKQAAAFAMRRLPHDMREVNANDAYFERIFMEMASVQLAQEDAGNVE